MPLKVLSRTSAAVESAKPRKPSSITRLAPTGSPHPREALWCSRHAGGYSDWMDDWPSKTNRRS